MEYLIGAFSITNIIEKMASQQQGLPVPGKHFVRLPPTLHAVAGDATAERIVPQAARDNPEIVSA
ncbi:MAG: hypothetical protein AB7E55_01870 [Pigmentiphaga sp.]